MKKIFSVLLAIAIVLTTVNIGSKKVYAETATYFAYRVDVVDSKSTSYSKITIDVAANVNGKVYAYALEAGSEAPTTEKIIKNGTETAIVANEEVSIKAYNSDVRIGKKYDIYICFEDKNGKVNGPYTVKNWEAKYFPAGDGTKSNPYQIWNYRHLYNVGKVEGAIYVKLMQNIDLADCPYSGEALGSSFYGEFDGNQKSILNMYGNLTGSLKEGAVIKDTYLVGVNSVTEGKPNVHYNTSTIAEENYGTITDCAVINSNYDTHNDTYSAGIISETNFKTGKITRCKVINCSIICAKGAVGGIVGRNEGTISDCYFNGKIKDSSTKGGTYGGIVGVNIRDTATVDNCYADVTYEGDMIQGGIAGQLSSGIISNCVSNYIPEDVWSVVTTTSTNCGSIVGTTNSGVTSSNVSNNQGAIISKPASDGTEEGNKKLEKLEAEWDIYNGKLSETGKNTMVDPLPNAVIATKIANKTGMRKISFSLSAYPSYETAEYNTQYPATEKSCVVPPVKTDITAVSIVSSGIKITWTRNASATGYYLYRSVNGGAYSLAKTITSNETVSYTDTVATTNGAKYQYKLVAYKTVSGTTYKSAESAVKTIYRVNAVGISSLANASTGITVKWAKNDQATGYYLYRSVNGGAYSLLKTITSNATVSYTDTTATTNGAKYQYKLVAYKTVSGTTYKSAESAVKTIYRVNAVGISSIANASSGVTIKWAKNTSATGYKLYRSGNGGAYSLLKTITSNATVSYTDTTATTNGAKYQYKMVAYKTVSGTTYTSTYCGVKTIYRVKPVGISSLTNASTGITVKWAKNDKATGYKLYRNVNGGAFSLLKTVTSNATLSYTDTKATTNGAKYQYKIVAYKTVSGATYTSTYSGAKTIYRLSRPAISSATNTAAGKVTVKWNKNDKASGYKIKYTVGTTTKTVKVTSAATVSKVLSSLTKGKTYSISVQSYKMVGSTPYYSAWSAAKSVKITR